MAKKSFGVWTFVIGGLVGGAVAFMGRGEIERIMAGFKGAGTTAQRAAIANRARYYRYG
jgi:hypothetical protein